MIILIYLYFYNDTATTEIYTLSLHDALPIWCPSRRRHTRTLFDWPFIVIVHVTRCCGVKSLGTRSEEHTSEIQSHSDLVCRLLLGHKKYRYNGCSHTVNR